ncbi:hypothetical protein [Thermophilibacter provencensis]|uniref:hypothetical protein n=1 Tax=Thermophilibacter provencensis TaxID=1852386 RepID=UPI003AA95712
MDEFRRSGDEERVGFEPQLAGAHLPNYDNDSDNDVEKLRAENAGATGLDDSSKLSRWCKIAGLSESEE